MRKLRLREWHWLTAGTQVQTRQTHGKMKSLWGGQIHENEQVNSCEYCELILKDEKCLSPTGMGKQYQCKILTCRKAFNLRNYAYISVRRSGAAEAEGIRWALRSHHNCVQGGGTLHHHHQNTLVGKVRCQRGAGDLAGVMLASVGAYPSDTSLTGRTALPYHWLPNGAQVHLIGRA